MPLLTPQPAPQTRCDVGQVPDLPKRRFRPSRGRVARVAGIFGVILLAAGLRIPRLDRRPMHADEAIFADKFGTMLAGGGFPYDPHDYHGPVLAYLAWIPAHLTGRTAYERLTESALRTGPAVAGILLALSPFLLMPVVGFPASLAASALIAASPVMVYYSRDFIPEMPLALWTALFLIGIWKPHAGWRALAGAAMVTMVATKETALFALAAGFFAKL